VTTTQADEFLWGFISGDSLNNPTTHTAGNSFTLLDEVTNGASFWPGATAYRIVAATGTYNSDFTQSGSSNTRVWIATFKAAGGGGGAVDVWRVRPSVNWSMTSTRGQKRSAWSDDAGIRDPSRDAREGYRTWSK